MENKKEHVKGVQNFCFGQLSMQILWRHRCARVVDLKLPNSYGKGYTVPQIAYANLGV